VIAIAGLQIGVNPDMTPPLQGLATLAIAVGWLAAGFSTQTIHSIWIVAALIAPALLRLAAGREGPVLDVFWMAGLTATLLRTTSWSQWSLGGGSQVLAGAWALTLALSWPIVAAREASFDWRLLFDLSTVNSWGMRNAPTVVAWTTFVAWTHLLGLLWLDWLTGWLRSARQRAPRVLHGLWIGATLSSLVGLYQGLADMNFLSTPQWSGLARATGTLLDANAFGFCAALAGPSAVLALQRCGSKRAGALVVAVLAVNLAALWMSGSRTATVCAVIGVIAVARATWQSADVQQRRRLPLVAAAMTVVIALLIVATGAIGPARRLFELPSGSGSVINNVFNRGAYGATAMEIITNYPLTGVGTGSYQELAPDYWRRMGNDELPFDNAQNWWRHQAAELGLLGGLPLLLWSGLIAWRVIVAKPAAGREFQATLVRGLLLAIGVCSLIQVPTQTPAVLLWFMTLLAWLPGLIVKPHATVLGGRWLAVLVAVVFAAGHLVLARGSLSVVERAKTFGREYVVGAYALEDMEGGGLFRWTDDESRFVWPARTRWFVINLWAHHPDIAIHPVRVSIATPCGPLVERELATPSRLSIGVVLPEGQQALDATIRVSRTWQPASMGEADRRQLGVGIAADSVASRELAMATHVPVELGPCPPAL